MIREEASLRPISFAPPSPRRFLSAGALASSAYLAEMALDMRITGNRYDDLVLWGDLLTRNPRRQRLAGLTTHFGVGMIVAGAYQSIRRRPPLPGWLSGLLFAQLENLVTFPSVIWADSHHPAADSGKLPRLWSQEYFLLSAIRHAAYGLVLGIASRDRR